ncbi:MAG TPA: helix-turn-helix domain-containing protein, partial [Ktedonobacterales bacterium]
MASPHPMSFGALLKRFRRAAGLTQEQLATRAGYSAAFISMLERNVRLPVPATIDILATALALDSAARAALLAAIRRPPLVSAVPQQPLAGPEALSTPLVGRRRELIQLGRHLAGEGPPLLLLTGEPGIGKSRLLHETARRAEDEGWTALSGGCHRRSGQDPYAPLLEALNGYLSRSSPAQLRDDLEGCGWLVRLLPELAERTVVPVPHWALPSEQERRLMFAAVGRYLANIAGPAGTLLLLDDVQWAGQDALDLIAALLRATSNRPLRVVAAYRSTEVRPQDPLALLLADLRHERLATQVKLGLLARDEAGELLARLLIGLLEAQDARLLARVLECAHGVPYFLV